LPGSANVSFYDEEYHEAVKLLNKFLKVRDRASSEVRSFFVSKGYSPVQAHYLVEKCIERGLINDKRFLDHTIHSYKERSYGRLYIEKKLRELGMEESEFSDFLDRVPREEWLESCQVFAQKLSKSSVESSKEWKSKLQKLLSRGFEEEIVRSVCQSLGWNLEFWDE
jgi:SOS response regulatory protein OraA/RecX